MSGCHADAAQLCVNLLSTAVRSRNCAYLLQLLALFYQRLAIGGRCTAGSRQLGPQHLDLTTRLRQPQLRCSLSHPEYIVRAMLVDFHMLSELMAAARAAV